MAVPHVPRSSKRKMSHHRIPLVAFKRFTHKRTSEKRRGRPDYRLASNVLMTGATGSAPRFTTFPSLMTELMSR